MKTYAYKGYDSSGKGCHGLVQATGLKDVREQLSGRQIFPSEISEAAQKGRGGFFGRRRHSEEERNILFRELEVLLGAGLPLEKALDLLIETPELASCRNQLAGMRDQLREGTPLAEAMAEAGLVQDHEKALIEAGEQSGSLDHVLERMADFQEEQQVVRERLQTAMIYPAFILVMSILIMVLMLGVMMPRFAEMFAEARVELPLLTRLMLRFGKAAGYVTVLLPVLLLVGGYGLRRQMKQDSALNIRVNRSLFRMPLFGRIYLALVNMRFARTLALLLRGGIGLVESLVYAGRAAGSAWVESDVLQEADAVRHGSSLADAVRRIQPLSGALPGWIQAGEASGDLAGMLEQAARRYQMQWERMIARFLALLEPILILLIGGFVLLIALAVLMPVMSLNSALGA